MQWRWDQGRLSYFQFDNICSIARVLCNLDGIKMNVVGDVLRQPITEGTDLPFLPLDYKVWRNYARVFRCAMLASEINNRLVVTDICKNLASEDQMLPDEYFNFVFSHFQYPFPAFKDYNINDTPRFPFVAIIKFLITRNGAPVSLQDIFSYIIGNDCTGLEELSYYLGLRPTSYKPKGDELRQVREMLVFMGQVSYIRWFESKLFIDTSDFDTVLKAVEPYIITSRDADPNRQFMQLTSMGTRRNGNFDIILSDRAFDGLSVKEGSKTFSFHNKIERSPLIRKWYFQLHPEHQCDACGMHPDDKYPWIGNANILELHHILPLAATVNSNGTTTTLDDMKPVCPNCHRSIHVFYRTKLAELNLRDFTSRKMANDIYEMAKSNIL